MRVPRKIKKKIPKGYYCYTFTGGRGVSKDGMPTIKIKKCPFYDWKNINGVDVPFCKFLNLGGTLDPTPSGSQDDEDKLVEYYGSSEKMWEELPLDLLWDMVKECNVNKGKES